MLSVGSTNIQTLLALTLGALFTYIIHEETNVWFRVCPFDFRLIFKVGIKFWMSDRLHYAKDVLHTWKAAEFSLEGLLHSRPNYKRSWSTYKHSSAHSCSSPCPHTHTSLGLSQGSRTNILAILGIKRKGREETSKLLRGTVNLASAKKKKKSNKSKQLCLVFFQQALFWLLIQQQWPIPSFSVTSVATLLVTSHPAQRV